MGDPRRHFYLRSVRQARFPVVLTHHALLYPDYLDGFFGPLLMARSQPYDALVCTSRVARDAVVNLLAIAAEGVARACPGECPVYRGQLPVIPLGVDTDLFRPRDVTDVRYQLGLPTSAFVALWLGRLSARTKADLLPLLRAYWLLRERNPGRETLLVMVGVDGEGYASVLEGCAAELELGSSVRIERTTPQTPIYLWYSAADVLVSPTDNLQESFGLAPIEAMASGIPQVVSDWDGHRDTVAHGVTGFCARTHWAPCDDDAVAAWACWGDGSAAQALLAQTVACDVGDLVGYLEQLLRSPDLRRRMAAASRVRAVAEFAWPVIVGRYADCWRALADQARSCEPPPPPAVTLPAFFRAFAGYASNLLVDESRVRIRVDAGDMIAGLTSERSAVPDTFDHESPERTSAVEWSQNPLQRVLDALLDAGGELTLLHLTEQLARDGVAASEVRRQVLRATKYGFLAVG